MGKIWSKEDVKKTLEEISESMGVSVQGIPITISKRMTSCKGECLQLFKNESYMRTTGFKFSYYLLDGRYDEETVREVIVHEYIHHYTNSIEGVACGHNVAFKRNCLKAGISPETYFTKSQEEGYEEIPRRQYSYKYLIRCCCCGAEMKRKQIKKNIETDYRCGRCGGALKVEKII